METGILLLTHRYFDPAAGRFLTRDPIGLEGGINLYAYVGNGVVVKTDEGGTASWMEVPWIIPGVGYSHAYIRFDLIKCDGDTSAGFWPPGSRVACGGTGSGSSKSSSDSCTGTSSWTSCKPCKGKPRSGRGTINMPDPDAGYGSSIAQINDLAFELALCACIRRSKQNPPEYKFGSYVCGSWVADMWECARRSQNRFRYPVGTQTK